MGMPEFKDAEYDRKLEEYKALKAKMKQAQQGNSSPQRK
jgi:NAD-dependent DNA ligase